MASLLLLLLRKNLHAKPQTLTLTFLFLVILLRPVSGEDTCDSVAGSQTCHDKTSSLNLKLIAIGTILVASVIGVGSPLVSSSPALLPGTPVFTAVKAFASGVILATGYMHVFPDAFDSLSSPCLPENSVWRKFPFAAFVAMLSALVTLMIDSASMSFHSRGNLSLTDKDKDIDTERNMINNDNEKGINNNNNDSTASELLRHRVVAQVLELGIVVHSVVIGLSLGASDNSCTIRPLIAALCFHQLFEGMGLGGCILQAKYGTKGKAIMVSFFALTTPFGIAMGIGLSNIYKENSPTALIVVGLLNACSAGLLHYMALVELLAADFLSPRFQASLKLQMWSYLSVLLGVGGMSLMAKWA